MSVSIEQTKVFIIFVFAGIVIGLLFDFFRILRKSIKTADFITSIEDGIFWILTGLLLTYIIFVYNDGEIRLFLILGSLLGLVIYLKTISRTIINISVKFISFLIEYIFKPIKNVVLFILKPFKLIFTFISKKVIFCLIKIKSKNNMLKSVAKKKKFTFFSKKETKKEGI